MTCRTPNAPAPPDSPEALWALALHMAGDLGESSEALWAACNAVLGRDADDYTVGEAAAIRICAGGLPRLEAWRRAFLGELAFERKLDVEPEAL